MTRSLYDYITMPERRICKNGLQISRNCSCRQYVQQKINNSKTMVLRSQNVHHRLRWEATRSLRNGCRNDDVQLGPLRSQSLFRPAQWCVFCTPSLAIFPTRCSQTDSNLANWSLQLRWDIIMIIIIMLTFIIRLLLQNKNIGAVQKYKNLEFL